MDCLLLLNLFDCDPRIFPATYLHSKSCFKTYALIPQWWWWRSSKSLLQNPKPNSHKILTLGLKKYFWPKHAHAWVVPFTAKSRVFHKKEFLQTVKYMTQNNTQMVAFEKTAKNFSKEHQRTHINSRGRRSGQKKVKQGIPVTVLFIKWIGRPMVAPRVCLKHRSA